MITRVVRDARTKAVYRAQLARSRSTISSRLRWRVDIFRSGPELPPAWSLWKRSRYLEEEADAVSLANRMLDSLTRIDASEDGGDG